VTKEDNEFVEEHKKFTSSSSGGRRTEMRMGADGWRSACSACRHPTPVGNIAYGIITRFATSPPTVRSPRKPNHCLSLTSV
jgi:hypothetical protein